MIPMITNFLEGWVVEEKLDQTTKENDEAPLEDNASVVESTFLLILV